ncbi:hypothetical protein C6P46_003372 [Rhodotorula mucilaginosa]|uniref:Exosome complex protein n=1 Tax=Rhodotorula mucilaginosa TaxID=5537 RepID=A0A9P6W4N9_RHOMI|nr:hypothetical protein C6P46_003372 [Rhodotorula mucilaginosa]TKA54098.1 hypothetical protein B0A53_03475 [Rhodotorula sp. CCFEE 5036]
MADTDPSATLAELSTSLTALEQALDPLLATPLQQHLEHSAAAADSPLLQARAHILASYVVHDLVWVYLKAAGIEPASHPVMQELERLKGYFGKLKAAQNGQSTTSSNKPDRPRMQIDKAAANRFISAAISSSRAAVDPNYTPASDDEDGSLAAATGPSGTHTRFTEAEKEDLDRLLEDHDVSDEDEDEDSDRDAEDSVVEEMLRGVRNGLAEAKKTRKDVEAATAGASSTGKKKRKAMDPFAGYDQPKPASATPTKSAPAPDASTTATDAGTPASDGKRKRKDVGAVEKDAAAGTGGGEQLSKKQRKKLRMKKEAAKAGGK